MTPTPENQAAAERALVIGTRELGFFNQGDHNPPADLDQAERAFRVALKNDPKMCDAWLGLAMVAMMRHRGTPAALADREIITNIYNNRNRFGDDQRRIGLTPPSIGFTGLYAAGRLNLPIAIPWDASLAYASIQAQGKKFDAAESLIRQVQTAAARTPSKQYADYLLGNLYFDTERWPKVLDALNASDWAPGPMEDFVHYMVGTACARLGLLTEAARRLDALGANSDGNAYNNALLERGYIFRITGDEPRALAHFEALRTHSDQRLSAEAGLALADPRRRPSVVTEEIIAARTDPWDPATQDTDGTEALVAKRKEVLTKAEAKLEKQVGIPTVKREVLKLKATVAGNLTRLDLGYEETERTHHMAFKGAPGTGKTTIARIVASIFFGLGILKKGHVVEAKRRDFVAENLGGTAIKTNALIDRALDGVLFITEAYTLIQTGLSGGDAFGKEALDTLLDRMEDDRHRLVVIIDGYIEEIDRFLSANDGLTSRISRQIIFPSYAPLELCEIARRQAAGMGKKKNEEGLDDTGFVLEPQAHELLAAVCTFLAKHETTSDSGGNGPLRTRRILDVVGNARFTRTVVEDTISEQLFRLGETLQSASDEEVTRLTEADIMNGLNAVLPAEHHGALALPGVRVKAGLSQHQLANLLGVNHETISAWESGDSAPAHEEVTEYARALGISLTELGDALDAAAGMQKQTVDLSAIATDILRAEIERREQSEAATAEPELVN